jgi:hypothetical protein
MDTHRASIAGSPSSFDAALAGCLAMMMGVLG